MRENKSAGFLVALGFDMIRNLLVVLKVDHLGSFPVFDRSIHPLFADVTRPPQFFACALPLHKSARTVSPNGAFLSVPHVTQMTG